MVFQDTYLQPNAPDPVLDEALVLALVRRSAPEALAVTAVDESGGEARTYAIDDDLILKTQRPHRLRPRTNLEKEGFFLRNLESVADISVPRVLDYGRNRDIEYICMTRMPGVALLHADLDAVARAAALRQLGSTLRRLHRVAQEPIRQSGLFPADASPAALHARFEETFDRTINLIEQQPESWPLDVPPEDVAAAALQQFSPSGEFVALHSNPGPEHTFVNVQTGAVSGLIDFGDAFISHPSLDLRPWRQAPDRVAVLEGYLAEGDVDPGFLPTYHTALIQAEMTAIVRGRSDPSGAAQTLRALLAEL